GSAGARPSDMARESWSLAPMCGQTIVPDPLSWVDLRKTGAETQEAIAMRALEGGNDEVIDAYLNVKTAFAKYMNNPGDDNAEVVEPFNTVRDLLKGTYHEREKVT